MEACHLAIFTKYRRILILGSAMVVRVLNENLTNRSSGRRLPSTLGATHTEEIYFGIRPQKHADHTAKRQRPATDC